MPNRPAAFDPGADSDARPTPHADVPELRDFSSDRRLLLLAAMAVIVGSGGALAAWALSRLINLVTQLAYFGRWSAAPADLGNQALGAWAVLVPVAGCLVIGLMARYGSEKIRGHGIPEAIEAILIGRSRIQASVAMLKPLSSAISIGTGGPFGAEGPIIMTGGAIGSLFAQMFHLTTAERKTLLVAGAAAGMTRHLRHADRGDPAGGRAAAVRVEAAQLHSGGGGGDRRGGLALLGCSAASRCFRSPPRPRCRAGRCCCAWCSASSPGSPRAC